MSNAHGRLAAALLPVVNDPSVAEALLSESDFLAPVTTSVPIGGAAARTQVRGKWEAAATAASSTHDPEALAKLARDSRKSVKRTVADNPHLDEATIAYLYAWALKHSDSEVMTSLARRVEPRLLVETLEARKGSMWNGFPYALVAHAVAHSGDPELVLRASAQGTRDVCVVMFRHARSSTFESPTLSEIAAALGDVQYHRESVIAASMANTKLEVCEEMAALVIDVARNGTISSLPTPWGEHRWKLTPEAAMLFASSGVSLTERYAAFSAHRLPAAAADALSKSRSEDTVRAFVAVHGARLTERRIANIVANHESLLPVTVNEILEAYKAVLPHELRLALVNRGGAAAATNFLSGAYEPNMPERGDAATLVPAHWGVTADERREAVRDLCRFGDRILGHAWTNELIEELSDSWLKFAMGLARPGDRRIGHIAERFEAAFGSDEGLWRAGVQFMPTWDSSLGSLIDTVLLTHGHDPFVEPEPEPEPEPDYGEGPHGQLQLL